MEIIKRKMEKLEKAKDRKHPDQWIYIRYPRGGCHEKFMLLTLEKPRWYSTSPIFMYRDSLVLDERDSCILITDGTFFAPEPMTREEIDFILEFHDFILGSENKKHPYPAIYKYGMADIVMTDRHTMVCKQDGDLIKITCNYELFDRVLEDGIRVD